MFGKKKIPSVDSTDATSHAASARVTVIPSAFYGGADPSVYDGGLAVKKKKETVAAAPAMNTVPAPPSGSSDIFGQGDVQTVEQKQTATKQVPPHAQQKTPPSTPKKNHLPMIVIVAAVILILGGVAVWYTSFRKTVPPRSFVEKNPTTVPTATTSPTRPSAIAGITTTTAPVQPEETPTTSPVRRLTFPPLFLADTGDLDIDTLTDAEEELFGTDSGIWDTDGDGYYDGQEVFNLYNPLKFAPVRLIDSGVVQDYINPQWQYRVYHPRVWQPSSVETDGSHILFSAITGEYIEIHAVEKDPDTSFEVWFASNAGGQRYSDLVAVSNRFEEQGLRRRDHLVAYFWMPDRVFILVYQPGVVNQLSFRHVMQMMTQSFRRGKVDTELPPQQPLPTATTTPSRPGRDIPVRSSDQADTSTTSPETASTSPNTP